MQHFKQTAIARAPIAQEINETQASIKKEKQRRDRRRASGTRQAQREQIEKPNRRDRQWQSCKDKRGTNAPAGGHQHGRVKVRQRRIQQGLRRKRSINRRKVRSVSKRRSDGRVKTEIV